MERLKSFCSAELLKTWGDHLCRNCVVIHTSQAVLLTTLPGEDTVLMEADAVVKDVQQQDWGKVYPGVWSVHMTQDSNLSPTDPKPGTSNLTYLQAYVVGFTCDHDMPSTKTPFMNPLRMLNNFPALTKVLPVAVPQAPHQLLQDIDTDTPFGVDSGDTKDSAVSSLLVGALHQENSATFRLVSIQRSINGTLIRTAPHHGANHQEVPEPIASTHTAASKSIASCSMCCCSTWFISTCFSTCFSTWSWICSTWFRTPQQCCTPHFRCCCRCSTVVATAVTLF